jgi:AraC-like DNA-binding protein
LRVQLERAETLLTQTEHTLEDIAGLAGFNDAAYFSVVFKREIGTTPGTFRARNRGPA